MNVAELIALLQEMPADAKVRLWVGWADDAAATAPTEVAFANHTVYVRGWMDNMSGTLTSKEEEG